MCHFTNFCLSLRPELENKIFKVVPTVHCTVYMPLSLHSIIIFSWYTDIMQRCTLSSVWILRSLSWESLIWSRLALLLFFFTVTSLVGMKEKPYIIQSSISLGFMRPFAKPWCWDVTSFCRQEEKLNRELLETVREKCERVGQGKYGHKVNCT